MYIILLEHKFFSPDKNCSTDKSGWRGLLVRKTFLDTPHQTHHLKKKKKQTHYNDHVQIHNETFFYLLRLISRLTRNSMVDNILTLLIYEAAMSDTKKILIQYNTISIHSSIQYYSLLKELLFSLE